MMRWMTVCCMALLCACPIFSTDPYDVWQAGQPATAVPDLYAQATATNSWQAWYDAGLAAAAADNQGAAVVWLLRAHQLAPWQPQPRQALSILQSPLPPGWITWLGPLAIIGTGWLGAVIAAAAGVCIGLAWWSPRRARWVVAGALCTLAVAPGCIASWHDATTIFAATGADTRLLDTTGSPILALPLGTIVRQADTPVWQGRQLVTTLDGRSGYIPVGDLEARPAAALTP